MPELTKDELVNLIKERINEEMVGLEVYYGLWNKVHKSNIPRPPKTLIIDTLNKIIADEEVHISRLEDLITDIKHFK